MRTPHLTANETDINYLASFISRNGKSNNSTTKVAKKVLEHINLFNILNTEEIDLIKWGLSTSQVTRVKMAFQLVQRSQTIKIENKPLINSKMVKDYIINNSKAFPFTDSAESFFILGLTIRQTVKGVTCIATGNHSSVFLSVEEITKETLKLNVPRVILVHNHPSGNSSPSDQDILLTKNIIELFKKIDVAVMDHIIIGQGEYTSLADKGFM